MPEETKAKSGFAFHCHHDVLVEWVENYDERVEYIKATKPVDEQELRLRLFQMIPADKLSGELAKLLEARDKVYETYTASIKAANKANETLSRRWEARDEIPEIRNKAWQDNDKAWENRRETRLSYLTALEDYKQLWETCQPEFVKLHEVLCPDCPWDGETIFPT